MQTIANECERFFYVWIFDDGKDDNGWNNAMDTETRFDRDTRYGIVSLLVNAIHIGNRSFGHIIIPFEWATILRWLHRIADIYPHFYTCPKRKRLRIRSSIIIIIDFVATGGQRRSVVCDPMRPPFKYVLLRSSMLSYRLVSSVCHHSLFEDTKNPDGTSTHAPIHKQKHAHESKSMPVVQGGPYNRILFSTRQKE